MSRTRRVVATTALLALVALMSPGAAAAVGAVGRDRSVIATFEGRTIRLADGWGDARACVSDDGRTARCYRSEAAMDAAEGLPLAPTTVSAAVASTTCSGPVRLYRSSNYGGGVLQLTARGQYLNLGTYGFDNDTSSYRIGPCGARFFDTAIGGGLYPGSTTAGTSSPTMVSGWDNRISSILIL